MGVDNGGAGADGGASRAGDCCVPEPDSKVETEADSDLEGGAEVDSVFFPQPMATANNSVEPVSKGIVALRQT